MRELLSAGFKEEMPKKGSGLKTGSKRQVWDGSADKTSGGLKKADLMEGYKGKIVSRKKHALGVALQKKHPLK